MYCSVIIFKNRESQEILATYSTFHKDRESKYQFYDTLNKRYVESFPFTDFNNATQVEMWVDDYMKLGDKLNDCVKLNIVRRNHPIIMIINTYENDLPLEPEILTSEEEEKK